MRGWFKLVLVMVAFTGFIAVGCGGGGGSGPEATVKNLFKAIGARDVNEIVSCCTDNGKDQALVFMGGYMAFTSSFEIANLETSVASQTDDTATVLSEYDLTIEMFGEASTYHESGSINLVKVDGKWLVDVFDEDINIIKEE